jgi:class 3 adenylate cyclase
MDDALRREARMGLRPWVAVHSLDQARMLFERRGAGDAERALRLLDRAVDLAREIGMPRVVEDALALRLEAQGIDASHTQRSIYAVARSVQDRRPDFGALTAPDGTVTLVFSDMEGFTAMTERLGDSRAHRVVQKHHAIVREKTRAHGGNEVELRGDGFLLAFADPARALRCCIDMQRAFAAYSEAHPEEPLRIRVGLHTGEAIRDADRFFGKTVIQAFRIADLARGGEILVSHELRQRVADAADLAFDAGREVELKGISGSHRLFAAQWT